MTTCDKCGYPSITRYPTTCVMCSKWLTVEQRIACEQYAIAIISREQYITVIAQKEKLSQ